MLHRVLNVGHFYYKYIATFSKQTDNFLSIYNSIVDLTHIMLIHSKFLIVEYLSLFVIDNVSRTCYRVVKSCSHIKGSNDVVVERSLIIGDYTTQLRSAIIIQGPS